MIELQMVAFAELSSPPGWMDSFGDPTRPRRGGFGAAAQQGVSFVVKGVVFTV